MDYTTVHKLTFYKHQNTSFNISTADSWISSGNFAIQTDDSGVPIGDDYVAKAEMQREGSLSMPGDIADNFTAVLDVSDKTDIFELLSNDATGEHKVYIVSEINIDGSVYFGYAQVFGRCMIHDDVANSKTLIHELGHNVGLRHTLETSDYWYFIMHPGGGGDYKRFLRAEDVTRFEKKQCCD